MDYEELDRFLAAEDAAAAEACAIEADANQLVAECSAKLEAYDCFEAEASGNGSRCR